MEIEKPAYDQNLYSRQEFTYGAETMKKLIKLRILQIGINGVGLEVAKNLVLAGPASLSVCDPRPLALEDHTWHFFFSKHKVEEKNSRAESVLKELIDMNSNVKVDRVGVKTFADVKYLNMKDYDVVVVCEFFSLEFMKGLNAAVRAGGAKLTVVVCMGLAGFIFNDFGAAHKVNDKDGENEKTAIISSITEDGLVITHEDKRHDLEKGDLVRFKEIVGMEALNGQVVRILEVPTPFSFKIPPLDPAKYGKYVRNGIIEEKKDVIEMNFDPLPEGLNSNILPDCDLDFDTPEKITGLKQLITHLWSLVPNDPIHDSKPDYFNIQHFEPIKKLALEKINAETDEDKKKNQLKFWETDIPKFILGYAKAELSPVSSFFGGIAAQEVIKVTGKYTPIKQWFIHEFYSTIFKDKKWETVPKEGKGQTAVFGPEIESKIEQTHTFLVGAGALGCEFLKMFALMNLGTKGKVTCTDDDQIEVSNLNRQFLFRRQHVGQSKSEVAVNVAKKINPHLHAIGLKNRVSPENESIFHDDFWDSLNFIVNAVDNVKAREYIDRKAVFHFKPMLDSGTLGTKCNTQVIYPGGTESYSDSKDPPEKQIPLCTLRSFPFLIEHVIEWSRSQFEEQFGAPSKFLHDFFADPDKELAFATKDIGINPVKYRELAESLVQYIELLKNPDAAHFVKFVRDYYVSNFDDKINQLITLFPADYVDKEGKFFWTSPKRPPTPLPLSQDNISYIINGVKVLAQGVKPHFKLPTTPEEIKQILSTLPPPKKLEIKPEDRDKLGSADAKPQEAPTDVESIKALFKELHALAPKVKPFLEFNEIEFEKDHDENGHIDFITDISRFRASNYSIPVADRSKVKFLAGRIIPAVATTTAAAVGAVGIEIYKTIMNSSVAQMRNFFANLALPVFNFSEPSPPVINKDKAYDEIVLGPIKALPPKFNTWARTEVKGPMTVQQLIDHVKKTLGFNVSAIMFGKEHVWNNYTPDLKSRIDKRFEDILKELKIHKTHGMKYLCLAIAGETDDMADVISPCIKYHLA